MTNEDRILVGWPVGEYRREKCDSVWHWETKCPDWPPDSNCVTATGSTDVSRKCERCKALTPPSRLRAYEEAIKKRDGV